MKLNIHNKIEIKTKNKTHCYFNTIFNNIYNKIANLESFFDKIAIGNGYCEDFSSNFRLGNLLFVCDFENISAQLDPSYSQIFVTKSIKLSAENFISKFITEAGITSKHTDEDNPEIYNYFSFITSENPNGIDISNEEEIVIIVTLYLTINSTSIGLLTRGENPFIKLLLGLGCSKKEIYVARGLDLSNNEFIFRTNNFLNKKYLCSISHNNEDNLLKLEFLGDLNSGEVNEIVFILDDIVFARINTRLLAQELILNNSFTSTTSYVIDLGIGVDDVKSVYNNQLSKDETGYFIVKYGNNFASKTHLPFNNLFDINTPRFLSLDGDKLFFVLNDIIYLYKNSNYNVEFIFAINLQLNDIIKITSFDNFVFIFTKTSPCIYAYKIVNNTLVKCDIDLSAFEDLLILETYTLIDIVQGKNGTFMFGFVVPVGDLTDAYTLYLTFNSDTNLFVYESHLKTSTYLFTYMLPFHKNNFSDAQIIYVQAGETSSKCRRAIHSIDKISTEGYNVTAYYYTYATTNICVKTRAVVVEKSLTPNLWLYYYPQVYRFNLAQLGEADKNYISTNLLYLIQKLPDSTYRAYNLVGYNNPEIFSKGIPDEIDQTKILYIEFLIDTVLFFMNDPDEPIIAYNLDIVGTCLENVSTKSQTYDVTYSKVINLGSEGKGVTAKFAAKINV